MYKPQEAMSYVHMPPYFILCPVCYAPYIMVHTHCHSLTLTLDLSPLARRIRTLLPENQKWWEEEKCAGADGEADKGSSGAQRDTSATAINTVKLQELEKEQKARNSLFLERNLNSQSPALHVQ